MYSYSITRQILEEINLFEKIPFAEILSYDCVSKVQTDEHLLLIQLNINHDNISLIDDFEMNILSYEDQ